MYSTEYIQAIQIEIAKMIPSGPKGNILRMIIFNSNVDWAIVDEFIIKEMPEMKTKLDELKKKFN